MGLCKLMLSDFMHGTGRLALDVYGTASLYSRYDLEQGLLYAGGWLEDGIKTEPFYKFRMEECTIIVSDALVQQVIKTSGIPQFLKTLQFKGRGGTNHVPVFKHIIHEKLVPELFIGLTDGQSKFPESKPKYPVLWCLTSDVSVPPWGKSVYIDV
jgi:hypothetical protein